jgi:SAM-dependent methyltransferase
MSGVVEHYTQGDENVRMSLARNRVEWVRTGELLARWLPPAPARVLDVGGGPGRQARQLLDLGYDVTLLDVVPKHVRQAVARGVPAVLADARRPPVGDRVADAVLMLGPLYHLPAAADRARALGEAARTVRPGGVVVVAGLSRWARVREVQVVGVEGPVGAWARADPALNDAALDIARVAESAMAAASIHLLACGRV